MSAIGNRMRRIQPGDSAGRRGLVTGLALGWGVHRALALTIAARFLIWFTFERPAAGSVAAVPTSAWRALLATAWPLGVVMRIGSVSSNLPRYLAEGFLGHAALGNLIVNSIGQVAMIPLARVAAAGDAVGFTIFCERRFRTDVGTSQTNLAVVCAVADPCCRSGDLAKTQRK